MLLIIDLISKKKDMARQNIPSMQSLIDKCQDLKGDCNMSFTDIKREIID